jgi:hypothetical protein
MNRILDEIGNHSDEHDPKEKVFLNAFTGWIKEALKHTNIIVVLGNQ